jgi:alcohol dehydrogenase
MERIEEEVGRLKGRKVMFIVDRAVKKAVEDLNINFNYEVFSEVESEPEIGIVDEVIDRFSFDTVVGVGGGSTLDVAKLTAVAAGEKVKAVELVERKLPERKCKLVLCPTTAGTGSEVTKLAVFKIPGREVKYVFDDDSLYADAAIVDPKLTLSCPPSPDSKLRYRCSLPCHRSIHVPFLKSHLRHVCGEGHCNYSKGSQGGLCQW